MQQDRSVKILPIVTAEKLYAGTFFGSRPFRYSASCLGVGSQSQSPAIHAAAASAIC